MVLGEHLRVKALVGASSLEADARESGPSTSTEDLWFKRERWPPPSDVTGSCQQHLHNPFYSEHIHMRPWDGLHP